MELDKGQMLRGKDDLLSKMNSVVTSAVADRVEEAMKGIEDRIAERFAGRGVPGSTTFSAPPAGAVVGETDTGLPSLGHVKTRTTGRVILAKAISAWSARRDDVQHIPADKAAERLWPGDERVSKALTSGDLTAGGSMVDGGYREEFIDLLTPKVAVRALGPVMTPMPEGSMDIPKVTADVTAYYVGESAAITKSQPATGGVKLAAKKLATLVPISNSLIRRAASGRVSRNMETFVQRLALRRMALREDLAFLRGAGTSFTPKGLINWAQTTTNANGTVNFANTLADLGQNLIGVLENSDVPMTNPGFIMAPRSKNYLAFQAVDGDGRPFFLAMIQAGELLGFPFKDSSQMPTNLGGGGDESEIILADFDQVLLGETEDMEVTTSGDASYTEGGSLVSAYARDETVVRVISEHDLGVEHPEAVAVLDQVTWGT